MPLASPPAYEALVERLGVKPLPVELLQEALTHASYLNESGADVRSNERLEFLGDSVLGMVIATELFRRYPAAGEGDLTRMRADIVRGRTLAAAAVRLGLGEHLVLGRGEEAAGGRTRERNMAGAMESIVGAVWVGHGYRAADIDDVIVNVAGTVVGLTLFGLVCLIAAVVGRIWRRGSMQRRQ